ncbi:hypothetical protein ABTY61_40335 [Kitasatospora sp. NPDC096128]|uniref:hypothetical protein n=1 Tax=Kitasatospora sp. NPDC096128 TaxID=3155547 RepID=UPI0033186ED8
MSDLFLRALEAAGSWGAVFAAVVMGVFLVFIGTAMAIALFHRDPIRAERAREIFKDLLGLFRRGNR